MGSRIAIDIGGTFTDLVAMDSSRDEVRSVKVLTTPDDLIRGVIAALAQSYPDTNLDDVEFFVHGTTAGVNAILERRGARVALLATRGFGDIYLIGRGNRPDMYNLHYRKPVPLVERQDIFEVDERVLPNGKIQKAPNERELVLTGRKIRNSDYTAVAVCFLHAYANPTNELRVSRG